MVANLQENPTMAVGCVYLGGYAVECALKAHLKTMNKPFPKSGREGHNLRALWAKCALELADLKDSDGARAYYLTQWTTDLRYQTRLETALDPGRLVKSAGNVVGIVRKRLRRRAIRRGAR